VASAEVPEASDAPDDTEETTYRLGANVNVEVDETGRPHAICDRCHNHIGYADEDWKAATAISEDPLSKVGQGTSGSEAYCLREFYCPDCGAVMDTEVAKRSDPSLVSRLEL